MPTSLERLDIATFLKRERDTILTLWEENVRALPSAAPLSRRALRNHIPDLLDEIIRLSGEAPLADGEVPLIAEPELHALQRLDQSFDLYDVVREYACLRLCILDVLDRTRVYVPYAQWRLLTSTIDHGIALAVKAYADMQQRTLRVLDRVSSAALSSPDLDGLLNQLLTVFVESVSSADTIVVLLREGDRLVVRASVGLQGRLPAGFSLGIDEGFAGLVMSTRTPQLLHDAGRSDLMRSPVARDVALRALYGVPLMFEGDAVGVTHMGSLTAYDFSMQDKRLFAALAERASGALAQHMLREQLRASEQRFRNTIDLAAVGIAHVAPDGSWLRINPRLCAIVGYSEAELLARTFQDITHPDDLAADVQLFEQLLRGEMDTYTLEKRYLRKDGSPVWINLTVSVVRDDRGAAEYFISVAEDISVRKAAEAAQAESRRGEQQALARLDAVVQAAPVGIAVLDNELRYQLVNDALAQLNGLPIAAHLGRRVRDVLPLYGEQLERRLRAIIDRGQPVVGMEFTAEPQDGAGERRHFLSSYALVYTQDNERIGLAGAVVEVTPLKRAQLEAEAATRSRDDLLAVVSHDLRTPLSSLKLGAEALGRLARGAPYGAQIDRMVEMMRRSALRMESMISDLLDMANLQAGRLAVECVPAPVAALLDEAFAIHQPLALEQGIALTLANVAADVQVQCDPDRIQQVLANLLGNALKFCPPGAQVRLSCVRAGREVVIEVADTGPGIRPEDLERVFDPYWSARKDVSKGTGLGLYISRGIVEAHGGRLTVESQVGAGATFRMTLPVIEP